MTKEDTRAGDRDVLALLGSTEAMKSDLRQAVVPAHKARKPKATNRKSPRSAKLNRADATCGRRTGDDLLPCAAKVEESVAQSL